MKDKIITLRVTQDQYRQIKTNAEKHGLTVSSYISNRVLSDGEISAQHKQILYSSLCIIKNYARENNSVGQIILGECEKIWQLLK